MYRLTLLLLALGCSSAPSTDTDTDVSDTDVPDSHQKGTKYYDVVFDDDVVQRLDIVIAASDFQAMTDDMDSLYGDSDAGGDPGAGPGEGPGGEGPGGDEGPGGFADEDPIYVPVTIAYGDETWEYVGMRYKGNSTLRDGWQQGIGKLPFRLHFDKYEDDYPEIDDQRFWGFQELKFSNAWHDDSLIHDRLASEIFRASGVPAAKTTFVRVHIDTGDGPVYWGLYTMAEDPCGALLDSWFGDDDGNCYKAEGTGATWQTLDTSGFEKKTNEDEDDFSDLEDTWAALHADLPADEWRAGLDEQLDTDGFLRALALNNLIQNWDAYGLAPHNYFLYGDPADGGKLAWIPWDFNEGFNTSRRTPLTLAMDEVGEDWPLIRYMMDDPTYSETYYTELAMQLDSGFELDWLEERARTYHELIEPWVIGDDGETAPYTTLSSESAFSAALDGDLLPLVQARHAEAAALIP